MKHGMKIGGKWKISWSIQNICTGAESKTGRIQMNWRARVKRSRFTNALSSKGAVKAMSQSERWHGIHMSQSASSPIPTHATTEKRSQVNQNRGLWKNIIFFNAFHAWTVNIKNHPRTNSPEFKIEHIIVYILHHTSIIHNYFIKKRSIMHESKQTSFIIKTLYKHISLKTTWNFMI